MEELLGARHSIVRQLVPSHSIAGDTEGQRAEVTRLWFEASWANWPQRRLLTQNIILSYHQKEEGFQFLGVEEIFC